MYSGLFPGLELPAPSVFLSTMSMLPVDEALITGDAIFKEILDTSIRLRTKEQSDFLITWKAFKADQAKFAAKQKALASIRNQPAPVPGTVPGTVVAPVEAGFSLSTPMIVGGASAALLVVALILKKRKKK